VASELPALLPRQRWFGDKGRSIAAVSLRDCAIFGDQAWLVLVTVAFSDGGDETYAIPMTHVSETVELHPHILHTLKGREVLMIREEVLPLIRLRQLLHYEGEATRGLEQVVVVEMAERRAAMVVDALIGQQEIVVKQFDGVQNGLTLFGGATILGDGAPALIIDVSSLL